MDIETLGREMMAENFLFVTWIEQYQVSGWVQFPTGRSHCVLYKAERDGHQFGVCEVELYPFTPLSTGRKVREFATRGNGSFAAYGAALVFPADGHEMAVAAAKACGWMGPVDVGPVLQVWTRDTSGEDGRTFGHRVYEYGKAFRTLLTELHEGGDAQYAVLRLAMWMSQPLG